MFGDFIGQTSTVVGTGADLTLGDPVGSGVTWRSRIADGEVVFYLDTTRNAQKRELGWGVLTHGTPDKIERNVLFSTQANARVSWAVDDLHTAYSVPVGLVMAYMLRGGLGDELPDWAPNGSSRWSYDDDTLSTLWKHRLNTAAGEIELGRHDVAKGAYFPSPRRPWVATGTAGKTIAANDIGGIFTFNNSAAARAMTLPPHDDDGIGHGFRVGGLGLTKGGQYGIVVTPAAADGFEAGAVAATLTIPGGVPFDLVWDQPSDTWRVEYLNTPAAIWTGRRQTVAAGPVDSSGLPTFLPATNGALSLTAQNISATARFVVSAANGWDYQGRPSDRVGVSLTTPQWTGLTASRAAATPNFLYVVVAADGSLTTGKTLLAPIYQWGGTPGTADGQFTFNIAEMKGYLGNGASAPEAFVVFVGEAATDGSGVISTVAYACNGRYDSGYTNTLPAAATATSRNHNIGVIPQVCEFKAKCTSADAGYAVGDEISGGMMWTDDGSVNVPFTMSASKLAASVIVELNVDALNKTTGVRAALTRASWDWRIVADRGWG